MRSPAPMSALTTSPSECDHEYVTRFESFAERSAYEPSSSKRIGLGLLEVRIADD